MADDANVLRRQAHRLGDFAVRVLFEERVANDVARATRELRKTILEVIVWKGRGFRGARLGGERGRAILLEELAAAIARARAIGGEVPADAEGE